MKVFEINWFTGHMALNVDVFFPASVNKAKKVFKLMRQYCSSEQIESLDEYLHQAKVKTLEDGKNYASEYRKYHQKAVDIQEIVDSGKLPIGLRVSEWELKEYKKDLKEVKKSERSYLSEAKAQERKFKSLERNIELLHTHTHTRIKGGDS